MNNQVSLKIVQKGPYMVEVEAGKHIHGALVVLVNHNHFAIVPIGNQVLG